MQAPKAAGSMSAKAPSNQKDTPFLESSLTSGCYNLSADSFMIALEPWEGCYIDVPFVTEHSADVYSLHSEQL